MVRAAEAGRTREHHFGSDVDVSGDTAAVLIGGYGWIYLSVRSGGGWSVQGKIVPTEMDTSATPDSLALSGDLLVLGGCHRRLAYVCQRTVGVWTLRQSLKAADGQSQNGYGYDVAASGGTALVGALQVLGKTCAGRSGRARPRIG